MIDQVKNKNTILFPLLFLGMGVLVGVIASAFSNNGPFRNFSKDTLFEDLIYIIILLGLMYFMTYLISKNHGNKLFHIIIIGLTIRILTIFSMSFFGLLPYQFDSHWDIHALNLLQDWNSGNFHFDFISSSNVRFYTIITTIVYYLLNPNPIYMQLLNAFFSIVAVYLVFLITKNLWSEKIAILSSCFMAFWPTIILFTSMHMRESLGILFLLGTLHFFLNWMKHMKLSSLIFVAVFLIGSVLIRAQNGILLALIIAPFIIIIIWRKSEKYMKPPMFIVGGVLVAVLSVFLKISGYSEFLNFNYIAREMNYRTDGGSAYLEWMSYGNIIDLVIFSPIRLFYFLFTPFPWQVTDFTQLIAFFESLILIYLTFVIFKGIKYLFVNIQDKAGLAFLVFFCLVGLTANAVIDSNVGTALRHKAQYIYIFFILFSVIHTSKSSSIIERNSINKE